MPMAVNLLRCMPGDSRTAGPAGRTRKGPARYPARYTRQVPDTARCASATQRQHAPTGRKRTGATVTHRSPGERTRTMPPVELTELEAKSLAEIPHPSLGRGQPLRHHEDLPRLPGRGGRELPHPRARHRPRVVGELRGDPPGHPGAAQGLRVGHLLLRARRHELHGHPRASRPPATPPSPASTTSTTSSRRSSPRAARSTAAASACRCTACARRT